MTTSGIDETTWPPAWNCTEKGSACKGCPHQYETCALAGRYNPNATMTLVVQAPSKDVFASSQNNTATPIPFNEQKFAVVEYIINKIPTQNNLPLQYNAAYLVGAEHRKAPKKASVMQCQPYLRRKLREGRKFYEARYPNQDRLHVIVTLGATATRAFLPNIRALRKARGQAYKVDVDGYEYVVVPTYGPLSLLYKPGLARMMLKDLYYAWKLSRQSSIEEQTPLEDLTRNHRIPRTLEEVKEVCDLIINYTDPEKKPNPEDWPIAADIETPGLYPYNKEHARINAISFSWDDGQATAILLDHNRGSDAVEYAPEDAWPHVKRVLASKKPKIFHNARFDIQFLSHLYGLEVRNLWWDTLLGEHYLDEDKRGAYGLKILTGLYCPEYQGYESEVQDAFFQSQEDDASDVVPRGQEEPDPDQSWELMAFFPQLAYEPASTRETSLEEEKRRELFELEHQYLRAHTLEFKKRKQSARGKIRRRCKKWDIEPPDTVKDRDYTRDEDMSFEDIPVDVLLPYAAVDADVTRRICKKQLLKMLKDEKTKGMSVEDLPGLEIMRNLYIPGTWSLSRMEYAGTRLNTELTSEYEEEASKLADEALHAMRRLTCQPEFNPNSSDQLGEVIREVLDIDSDDYQWTDTGALSVRKQWQQSMAEKYAGTRSGEFFYYLQVYKAASKAKGSFLSNFRDMAQYDGRIHTSFNLNGTATGRLSSAGPNLQNVPKWMCRFSPPDGCELGHRGMNIKALFIPTDDEHAFWQLDIAAAEIRVLCAYARDEKLIQALRDGLDVHSFIASHIFDIPYDEFVAKKESDPDIKLKRTATKRVVFGMIYGAGPYKIAEQIFGALAPEGTEKREEQIQYANDVMDLLFNRFPRINQYITTTNEEAIQKGQVETYFGRKRRFPLKDTSWKAKARAQRMAVNFKIQSTASDIVLSQLCEVERAIDSIGGRVLLTVHDSIAGEIHRDRVPEMRAFFDHYIVERVKERFPWLPVPFKYDLEVGPSYGELVAYETLEEGPASLSAEAAPKVEALMERAGLRFFTTPEAA